MKYYRCGADKGQCERARTGEIQPGAEWVCLSNNPNCLALREEVSWISIHKHTLALCAAGLLGIIVVWGLWLMLRTDALAKELSSSQAQAASLHSRLADLEGGPSKGSANDDRAQRLRDLCASARSSSANVLAVLKQGNRNAAQKSFAELEANAKAAEEIGSNAAKPAAGTATTLLQGRKLSDDYQ